MTPRSAFRKEIFWIGTSLEDLRRMPDEVKQNIGHALHEAQLGEKPASSKPLSGFGGAHVLEIRDDDEAGTYRAVYTVKFKDRIFVLHCFQKKSKKGIKTPKSAIDLIGKRFKEAQEIYQWLEQEKK
jgi:phage-related protein